MSHMPFQQHLRRERELRGWSQSRMAQELGTTPNTISAWERGVSLPSPYFREKLYELLGKNAVELGLLEESSGSVETVVMSSPKDLQQNGEPASIGAAEEPATQSQESGPQDQPALELDSITSTALMPGGQKNVVSQVRLPILQGTMSPTTEIYNGPHTSLQRPRSLLFSRLLLAIGCLLLLSVIIGGTFVLPRLLAPANPYAPYAGTLLLNDPLADQNPQVNWQEGWNANHASCQFKQGTYHVFQPRQGYFHACIAQLTNYSNFTYEVEMTLLQGDYGGLLFRAVNSIDSQYYFFRVNKDGSYTFKRYIDGIDNDAIMLDTGFAQAYHVGYGQKNRLAVVADNNRLTLYINGQDLVTVSDGAYTHGQIGVLAGNDQQAPAEASFSNVRVWG